MCVYTRMIYYTRTYEVYIYDISPRNILLYYFFKITILARTTTNHLVYLNVMKL